MKRIRFVFFALVLFSCSENKEKKTVTSTSPFSTEGKKVIVYTTADSSNYKLSAIDTLEFKQKGQPFENEVTVFVDPGQDFSNIFWYWCSHD